MIITVTLNPCLDKTIYLDTFEVGEYNRVADTRSDLAGKGINVSTVLKNLGDDTICTGLNFLENGADLERVFAERGLRHDFVMCAGAIRTNTKLFDRSKGEMTEINEAGPAVTAESVESLIVSIDSLLENADLLVMSGSIPPGVPGDIYATLIRLAHAKGVKTVLDSAGEPFDRGLEAKPDLIKPNLYEFGLAFGDRMKEGVSMLEVARSVVNDGISYICISMGGDGAMLVSADEAFQAAPAVFDVRGLTGAGDSLVAGMCHALIGGLGTGEMLRYGIAASGASVRKDGTLLASGDEVRALLPAVKVERLF